MNLHPALRGVFTATNQLRWKWVTVQRPSSFTGGPGFPEKVKQLQQKWVTLDGRKEDWRPVPEVE